MCRPTAIGARRPSARGNNFRIGDELMPLPIINALAIVKRAAAEANRELGLLDARRARAIVAAAEEIIDGKLDDQFPLVVWQTGSGTQSNMNVNEVIANRANELLGGRRGAKDADPSQRSRQHEPVVERLLSDRHAHRRGAGDLVRSADSGAARICTPRWRTKTKAFCRSSRSAAPTPRTPTPLTLGQEFSGYAAQVKSRHRARARRADELYPLAQGGTAVGTGLNAPTAFARLFAAKARRHHRPALRHRAQQVRGAGRAWRDRVRARRAQRTWPPTCSRSPTTFASSARARAPAWASLMLAGKRAGLVDHARQSQSDPVRSADHGLLPGVRQRDHDRRRGKPGPLRTQRLQAGHRLRDAAIDPAARRRGSLIHRSLRRRHTRQRTRASTN